MTDTRRGTGTRSSRTRSTDRSWLVGVLTHHPVAKLFSLGFAMLLVMLIDRELLITLYDNQTVAVVASAEEGERNRIVIEVDSPYVVLIEPGTSLSTSLTVKGRTKERDELLRAQPFRARLPKDRLDSLFTREENESHEIALEPTDLEILDFDESRIELGGLRVEVAKLTEQKVVLGTSNPGPAIVTFTPETVTIVGPAPFLKGSERKKLDALTGITLDITEDMSPDELRGAIDRWLKKRPGGAYLSLSPDEAPAVKIDRSPVRKVPVDLDVTIGWIINAGDNRYQYALDTTDVDLKKKRVKFLVPETLKDSLPIEQIQKDLVVYANVMTRPDPKLMEAEKTKAGTDKPDLWWVNENAPVEIGPDGQKELDRWKLTLEPGQLLRIHARVRPPTKG